MESGSDDEIFDSSKVSSNLTQAGYRDGKVKAEEALFQESFDVGFTAGIAIGRKVGELHAEIQRTIVISKTLKPIELEALKERGDKALQLLLHQLTDKEYNKSALFTQLRSLLNIFPSPVILALEELKALSL